MKRIYPISILLLLTLLLTNFSSAQCGAFYDGFDSGSANPLWVNQAPTAYTLSFPTTSSPVGTNHLQMTGFSGHYGGLLAQIPPATPSNISYYAKPGQANTHDGYFTCGDGNLQSGTNTGIVFIYFQANTGILRILGGGSPSSIQLPYVPNVWYHIELRNINWVAKTFDVWVDGTSHGTLGFWNTTPNSIERIHLYNYNASSTAWYDEIIIGGNPITHMFSAVDPLCNGDSTGTATFNTTGGTGSISYLWNTGDTTNSISNLMAGTYSVTATDSAGCVVTDTVVLADPPVLTASIAAMDITCPGGSDGAVDVTATGGTPPLQYLWNTGDTTEDLSGLAAGNYVVSIADSNGCSTSASSMVTAPSAFASNFTVSDISCFGETDGSIDMNVSGGTAPYMYMWSTGDTLADLDSLSAGTYTVMITDTNGCTFTDSASITEPTAMASTGTVTDETNGQSDGSIDVTISGGTGSYTYAWTGPNGYTSTTEDPASLEAGEYIVVATDANGCTVMDTFMVNNFVGIEPGMDAGAISVYPNPFTETFTLSLGGLQVENLEYRLLDLTGRILFTEKETAVRGGYAQEFELKDRPAGVYMLEVFADGQRKLFQVVKQ